MGQRAFLASGKNLEWFESQRAQSSMPCQETVFRVLIHESIGERREGDFRDLKPDWNPTLNLSPVVKRIER